MRYKVIRNCYWKNRLWEKGEEVELEGEVPEHFRTVKSIKEKLNAVELPSQPELEETTAATDGVSLEEMNPGQLQKLARENGLKMPKTAKKEELISALRGE